MKKLSIIIPLFNVEKFIARATKSIVSQAFDGLEIVIVDDGSTDNSYEVCLNGLAGLDVIGIKQENSGPGGARNTALKKAAGEYILFLDGDDFLLPGAFENIMKTLDEHKPDALFGRYVKWMHGIGFLKSKTYEVKLPDDPEKRTEYILGGLPELSWNIWRYVCRRKIIIDNCIFFHESAYCQDMPWVLELLETAESVVCLSKPFYAYNYRRQQSITNTFMAKRFVDRNKLVSEMLEKCENRPVLCRAIVHQAFLYINEYRSLNKQDKKAVYDNYKGILPLFRLSDSVIHKLAAGCKNKVLFNCLSIALSVAKAIRNGGYRLCATRL